jgi:hypothetical protein
MQQTYTKNHQNLTWSTTCWMWIENLSKSNSNWTITFTSNPTTSFVAYRNCKYIIYTLQLFLLFIRGARKIENYIALSPFLCISCDLIALSLLSAQRNELQLAFSPLWTINECIHFLVKRSLNFTKPWSSRQQISLFSVGQLGNPL